MFMVSEHEVSVVVVAKETSIEVNERIMGALS